MIFANIEYLFLLVLLIPYIIWYVMKRKKTEPTLQVSNRYFNSLMDALSLVSKSLSMISEEVISIALKPKRSAI